MQLQYPLRKSRRAINTKLIPRSRKSSVKSMPQRLFDGAGHLILTETKPENSSMQVRSSDFAMFKLWLEAA